MRPLVLRREPLTELTPGDLAAVQGASVHFTIDTFLTQICTLVATAVLNATKQATGELTLVECA
ncbi:MAG TPA: hypothetical protein VGX28_07410 [Frankiaceae bacterium]|jgi:hypothetical protein|nr:hypothetical protein [Frankiaceae bacterium]